MELNDILLILIGGVIFFSISTFLFKISIWQLKKKDDYEKKYDFIVPFEKPIYIAVTLLGLKISLSLINLNSNAIDTFFVLSLIGLITYILFILIDLIVTNYDKLVEVKNKSKNEAFLKVLKTSAKLIVILLSTTMALKSLGVDVLPIISLMLLIGAALILAFQDTLANFFAGVYLTADKPINVGDYIKINDGKEGYVVSIGWRNTQIRTNSNNLVIIPNSKIAQNEITNYYSPTKDITLELKWLVSYESNLEKVEKITMEVAREVQKNTKGALPDFQPIVRFSNLNEKGIEVIINIKVSEFSDKYEVTHEFVKLLHTRYKKEKISFTNESKRGKT